MAAKVDLRNTIARSKFLVKQSENTLEQIGQKIITHLTRQWVRGIGGDGIPLSRPPISRKYKRRKMRLGRPGMIDMVLFGKMIRNMIVKKIKFNVISVGFTHSERDKIKGNVKRRPQIMRLAKRFKRNMLIFYLKKLRSA